MSTDRESLQMQLMPYPDWTDRRGAGRAKNKKGTVTLLNLTSDACSCTACTQLYGVYGGKFAALLNLVVGRGEGGTPKN
eukprot:SAG31_NODE_1311_length_8869_cov_10.603535_2_plen_79_part_00